MSETIRRKITFFSFLYAAMMVYYHTTIDYYCTYSLNVETPVDSLSKSVYIWLNSVGSYGVSFFFTLSAFLLFYNLEKSNLLKKLKGRVFSLFIPMCLWNIFFLLVFNRNLIIQGDVKSIVLGIFTSSFDKNLWFVGGLLVLLILMVPIWAVMRKPIVSEIVLLFIIASIWILGWNPFLNFHIPTGSLIMNTWGYIPNYFLGAYLGLRIKNGILRERYPIGVIIFSGVLFLLSFINVNSFPCQEILNGLHGCFLWVLIPSSWFKKDIGLFRYSFPLFAIHEGIYRMRMVLFDKGVELIGIGWFDLNAMPASIVLGYRVIMGTLNILLCLLIAFVIKKIAPKIYSVIMGGRG